MTEVEFLVGCGCRNRCRSERLRGDMSEAAGGLASKTRRRKNEC